MGGVLQHEQLPAAAGSRKRSRTPMDVVMRLVFIAMFGGLGVMLLYVGVREHLLQRRALAGALEVPGRVLAADVRTSRSSDTDSRLLRDNSTTTHAPEVRFMYTYGGVEYQSDQLYPTVIVHSFASRESAMEEIAEFAVGSEVRVYVDPAVPERGFLRATAGVGPPVFVISGILALGFLAVVLRFI